MQMLNAAVTRLVSDDTSPKNYRVIAFPFAGGSGGVFHPWKPLLDKNVEVLAYTPPGRSSRFQDEVVDSMEGLLEDIWKHVTPFLDKPFILFGHSLGSLVAFEFFHKLVKNNKPLPFHFISSARKAPSIKWTDSWTSFDDKGFLRKLDELGGLHPDIASNEELLELLVPILRADITIVEQYRPGSDTPLSCPATVFGGHDDVNIPKEALQQWQQHFTPPIQLKMFDAGHFYLDTHAKELTERISDLGKLHFTE